MISGFLSDYWSNNNSFFFFLCEKCDYDNVIDLSVPGACGVNARVMSELGSLS